MMEANNEAAAAGLGSDFIEAKVPYKRRIFCNRNLRLDSCRYIGFDMDYTLALYHEQMEHLQAEMVLARMVEKFGYPRELLALKYDPGFAIRGLAVDTAHGNVFKMDAHRFVGKVWHGHGPLDRQLRKETYSNRRVGPADPELVMVDTLFSLPEISLYCQLVGAFDGELGQSATRPSYDKLWADMRSSMDSLHGDDSLKQRIMADIGKYIVRDPELPEALHRFRSSGKRLFVMTNSEPVYTMKVMSYLLDGSYPGYSHWSDYFDYVFTFAKKPRFFEWDKPFYGVNTDTGEVDKEPATSIERGGMYFGGNLKDFKAMTGMIGDEVLYVGDHIYGDILRSKRYAGWRTAMVIQEMERELSHVQSYSEHIDQLHRLEETRFQLNLERAAKALDGTRDEALLNEIRGLNKQIAGLERETAEAFNPYWGMLFRDRSELSAFGQQVESYACIYTSRVSNFRLYSPMWYFRSPRDRMAHELRM